MLLVDELLLLVVLVEILIDPLVVVLDLLLDELEVVEVVVTFEVISMQYPVV